MTPLVSVIMPTYNRVGYLRAAVESVLAQTWTDLELIIVDDGSTDETPQYLGNLTDSRVHVLTQPNQGESTARNSGIAHAQGEFTAFLDDDDIYLPHKIERQVTFLREHVEADLVAVGSRLIDSAGTALRLWSPWLDQPDLTLRSCIWSCPLLPSAVMVRTESLRSLDHVFDATLRVAQDTDLFLRLLLAGRQFDWLREHLLLYRQHAGAAQRSAEHYRTYYPKMIDGLLARSDLPPELATKASELRAHYLMMAACREAWCAEYDRVGEDVLAAIELWPGLADGAPARYLTYITGFAAGFLVADPPAYVADALAHLPTDLQVNAKETSVLLSQVCMRRVFDAAKRGERPALRDWLWGAWLDPRWLRNRGVWSILIKRMLLRRQPTGD